MNCLNLSHLKLFLLFLIVFPSEFLYAQQIRYVDAKTLTLVGKIEPASEFYHRLDTIKYYNLPSKVKYLATYPAGMAIGFKTTSATIRVRWSVKPDKPSPNLPAIAFKGLDLYIKRNNGEWIFAGIGKPSVSDLSVVDFEDVLVKEMNDAEKECLLYLPFLAEIKKLEIGVDSSAQITPVDYPFQKKIVIYGTSIVHGISASRPGLNYPSRLSRNTGLDFINLGFSGNAKAESTVADFLSEIEADAFILDYVANTTVEQIRERTSYLVKTIRTKHPDAPVIVMQSIPMDIGNFNLRIKNDLLLKDEAIKHETEKLQKEGVQKLYFIEGKDLIGHDREGTSDGIHPNDSGVERMIEYLQPRLLSILKHFKQ